MSVLSFALRKHVSIPDLYIFYVVLLLLTDDTKCLIRIIFKFLSLHRLPLHRPRYPKAQELFVPRGAQ